MKTLSNYISEKLIINKNFKDDTPKEKIGDNFYVVSIDMQPSQERKFVEKINKSYLEQTGYDSTKWGPSVIILHLIGSLSLSTIQYDKNTHKGNTAITIFDPHESEEDEKEFNEMFHDAKKFTIEYYMENDDTLVIDFWLITDAERFNGSVRCVKKNH